MSRQYHLQGQGESGVWQDMDDVYLTRASTVVWCDLLKGPSGSYGSEAVSGMGHEEGRSEEDNQLQVFKKVAHVNMTSCWSQRRLKDIQKVGKEKWTEVREIAF